MKSSPWSPLSAKFPPGRLRRRRQGTTTVEFGLVLPIFFLFIFGLIDVGRGFMTSHLLTNAARQGCRQSVVQNKSTADIEASVKTILESQGIKGHTTVVRVNGAVKDVSTAQSTDEISVVVSVPVSNVTWIPVNRFLVGTITGHFSLRRE